MLTPARVIVTIVVALLLRDGELRAQSPIGVELPGWPVPTPGFDYPAYLRVCDLDGDGASEVIVPQYDRLTVFDGDGGPRPGWPWFTESGFENYLSYRAPAIGDVTGDGIAEIVVVTRGWDVYVLDASGQVLPGWPQSATEVPVSDNGGRPALGDLDGDGVLDIVVQGLVTPSFDWGMWAFRGDGTVMPGWPVGFAGLEPGFGGFAVGDLDFDGTSEVVVTKLWSWPTGIQPSPTYVFDGEGQLLRGWPVIPDLGLGVPVAAENPMIVDLDGDHVCEIVGVGEIFVHSLRMDGTSFAGPTPAQFGIFPPGVADLDPGGRLEIVALGYDLRLVDPISGVQQTYSETGVLFVSATVADVVADSGLEIVAMASTAQSGRLYLLDHELNVLPGWPVSVASATPYQDGICLGDLDGDGDLELVFAEGLQVHAIDLENPSGQPLDPPWPMRFRDGTGSSFYHVGAVPEPRFTRGDVDRDGVVLLNDAVQMLLRLFQGQSDSCPRSSDVNVDQLVDISDVVYLLSFLFLGTTPALESPYPDCGVDGTSPLPCAEFECP